MPATQSATLSPITIAVALVLALGTWGMIDESATQSPVPPPHLTVLVHHCHGVRVQPDLAGA